MTRRLLCAAVGVTLATAALLFGSAGSAAASCMPPAPVPDAMTQADVVFVGTVTSTRSRDRIATFQVLERWKGDVGRSVEVFGGPATDRSATSVDRTWAPGTTYLVFAIEPAAHGYEPTFGGRYESSTCSTTQAFTEQLAANRPPTATRLSTEPPVAPTSAGPATPTRRGSDWTRSGAASAAVVALLIAAALLWRARQRRRVGAAERPPT